MTEPPVLPAVVSPSGETVSVWCRYCDRFHTHGNVPGHRVAHCIVDDSPYRQDGGYVLDIVPGTQKTVRPPQSERRKPRRGRYSGLLHGWNDER